MKALVIRYPTRSSSFEFMSNGAVQKCGENECTRLVPWRCDRCLEHACPDHQDEHLCSSSGSLH